MADPKSSNPLEPIFDAASELAGKAFGALIDPFGSASVHDESTEGTQTVAEEHGAGQFDEYVDDKDDDSVDDNGDDDDVGSDTGEYFGSYSSEATTGTTKYYESNVSASRQDPYARSTLNTFSNESSTQSDASNATFSELFSSVGKALSVGLCLYPLVGLGGCLTRLIVQGPPPHPMYQQQAHDQWLNFPVKSWTTEALIIPLAFVAITFFRGLMKTRHDNPVATFVLFLVGGAVTILVGIGLTDSPRTNSQKTRTVPSSNQTVGTMREVNAIKLNMRSGPGSNYPIVATFSKKTRIVSYGETVTVRGELWTQASSPDGQTRGWVNRKFLSP